MGEKREIYIYFTGYFNTACDEMLIFYMPTLFNCVYVVVCSVLFICFISKNSCNVGSFNLIRMFFCFNVMVSFSCLIKIQETFKVVLFAILQAKYC